MNMKMNIFILGFLLALFPVQAGAQIGIVEKAAKILDNFDQKQDLTADLAWIRHHWETLPPEVKARYQPLCFSEPLGSNRKQSPYLLAKTSLETDLENVKVIKTDNFRILWGNNFKLCPDFNKDYLNSWGDADLDGVPYFIEKLAGTNPYLFDTFDFQTDYSAGICEFVWQKVIQDMGFHPPQDSEEYYLDVYIANTGVANPALAQDSGSGVTLPDTWLGVTSTYSSSGRPYLIINQDLNVALDEYIKTMQVTLAHEFFHAVQLSYIPYAQLLQDPNLWLAEGTATWMEDTLYPAVNDYTQYVNQWVNYPQKSLFSSSTNDNRYGSVLFFKYLSQNYHQADDPDGAQVIRSIWTQAQDLDPVQAIQSFIQNQTVNPMSGLQEAYLDFALKNIDFSKNYTDGALYHPLHYSAISLKPEKGLPEELAFTQDSFHSPAHFGSTYIEGTLESGWGLDRVNRLALDFQAAAPSPDTRWQLSLVLEEDDGTYHVYDASGNATGDTDFTKSDAATFSKALLVVSAVPKALQDLDAYNKKAFQCSVNSYLATRLNSGWNLKGFHMNSLDALEYGVQSIWTWNAASQNWHMDLPGEDPELIDAYLSQKGFAKLGPEQTTRGAWYQVGPEEAEILPSEPADQLSLPVDPGWNLLANGALPPLQTAIFNDSPWCESLWKWDSPAKTWQVALPGSDQDLKAYLQLKGFAALEKVYFSEGFWLHSSSDKQETVSLP